MNWEQLYNEIFKPLSNLIVKSTTSISKLKNDNAAYAHGTGSYIKYKNDIFLITNQHVVTGGLEHYLSHIPGPTDHYMVCKKFCARKYPYDIALMKLTDYWSKATKIAFDDKFDDKFQPVENEFLFWVGYPGTTLTRHDPITETSIRSVYFDVLNSPAIPFLTTVNNNFNSIGVEFDEDHHFAINYPENGSIGNKVIMKSLPNPRGLSGSLVWDTKFIKTIKDGKEWSPSLSKICGIIWADYPKTEVIFATKVETMNKIIDEIYQVYDEAIEIYCK